MSDNSKKRLTKMPEPICTQLYNIYFEHVGILARLKLQKRAVLSSILLGVSMLSSLALIFTDSFSNWQSVGLVLIAALFSYCSYVKREAWIKKNLRLNSYSDWLNRQKVDAYYEVKKQKLLDSLDTNCRDFFNKEPSFWESKTNMLVAGLIVPVWSVFLGKLDIEHVNKIFGFLVFLGMVVVYFNYLFYCFSNSRKSEYFKWLESCKDCEKQE